MTRKIRSKTKVDLSKPVTDHEINGCFGVLWNTEDTTCLRCDDRLLCGELFRQQQVKKVKELNKKNKYLDLQDFSFLEKAVILDMVKQSSGKITFDNLLEFITKKSNSKDKVACDLQAKRFCEKHSITIKEGVLWTR